MKWDLREVGEYDILAVLCRKGQGCNGWTIPSRLMYALRFFERSDDKIALESVCNLEETTFS